MVECVACGWASGCCTRDSKAVQFPRCRDYLAAGRSSGLREYLMTVYERAACREGEITKAIYVIRPCTHGLLNKCVLYERCSRVEKKTSACTAHGMHMVL